MALLAIPASLKPVQHYMKTATEHEKRDVVVAYYCRLYALQKAMEIDKKSPEARAFLVGLMDLLEQTKNENKDSEAISNEVVGQAHVEHYALQIFLYADNEDRAGRFGKNVVKSFYTAGMMFDVLSTFGELSEDIVKNQKYAKWKAAYIHKCLKNGETPIAGPLPENEEEFGFGVSDGAGASSAGAADQPMPPASQPPYPPPQTLPSPYSQPHAPPTTPSDQPPPPVAQQPPPVAHQPPALQVQPQRWQPPANPGGVQLNATQYQRAMKLCKFATSALQYEDSKAAIENLTKALNLLSTGHE